MNDDLTTYDPRKFFEVFVGAAYKEYLADPLSHLRVKTVVSNADTLAERMWVSLNGSDPTRIANAKSPRAYREYLVQKECSDFQIVWDMHDGHKHVELSRRNRQVTSSSQSGVASEGGALGSAPLGAAPLGGTIDRFIVRLDNGIERELADVLKNVIEMWVRLLSEL